MTRAAPIHETVTVRVAFRVIKRGGRKQIVPPPDAPATRPRHSQHPTTVPYRWPQP